MERGGNAAELSQTRPGAKKFVYRQDQKIELAGWRIHLLYEYDLFGILVYWNWKSLTVSLFIFISV